MHHAPHPVEATVLVNNLDDSHGSHEEEQGRSRVAEVILDEIGYEDYFYGQGICLIEWASRIEELIPAEAIHVCIDKDLEKGLDYRRIRIQKGE